MALVVRLQRAGKRTQPHYRIVATEKSTGPKGSPVEILGHYNPKADKIKDKVQIRMERIDYWMKNGAKLSETVKSLINKFKLAKV